MIKWVLPRSLVNRQKRIPLPIAAGKNKSTVDIDRAFFIFYIGLSRKSGDSASSLSKGWAEKQPFALQQIC